MKLASRFVRRVALHCSAIKPSLKIRAVTFKVKASKFSNWYGAGAFDWLAKPASDIDRLYSLLRIPLARGYTFWEYFF